MAPKKKAAAFVTTAFLILQAVLALNMLGLITLLVGQYVTGNLTKTDYLGMLFALRGTGHYVMEEDTLREFARLKEAEAKEKARLAEEKGTGPARYQAPQASIEMMRIQQENAAVLKSEIEALEGRLKSLRSDLRQLVVQKEEQTARLASLKEQETATLLSANHQELEKTFANMDAENIATFLSGLLVKGEAGGGGRYKVAQYLREFLKPALRAEVIGEMPPPDTQQILPLLQNEFADRSPSDIVQLWKQEGVVPEQMAEYLRRMPVPQAFRTYMLLSGEHRGQVAQLLQEGGG